MSNSKLGLSLTSSLQTTDQSWRTLEIMMFPDRIAKGEKGFVESDILTSDLVETNMKDVVDTIFRKA